MPCLTSLPPHASHPSAVSAAGPEAHTEERPSFSTRLIVLHGAAATVTIALAALTALVLGP